MSVTVIHTSYLSIQEAGTGELPRIQGYIKNKLYVSELHTGFLEHLKKQTTKKNIEF